MLFRYSCWDRVRYKNCCKGKEYQYLLHLTVNLDALLLTLHCVFEALMGGDEG